MQVILNSERRELGMKNCSGMRNCSGIFSKEIREIDEFQLKTFKLCFQISIHYTCDFFFYKYSKFVPRAKKV